MAITNHDLFDRENFNIVKSTLQEVKVFPGIELSLDIGHVNIVVSESNVKDLEDFSDWLKDNIEDQNSSITTDQLFENLHNWQDAIYIFEYGKSNGVESIPSKFKEAVCVHGVRNQLRFNAAYKQEDIVPVLFSDAHATEDGANERNNITKLKEKNTYIQADSCEFSEIKACFGDKQKININKDNLHDVIKINDNYLSKGLNLVVGKRGTGKTYFIEQIKKSLNDEAMCYIRQFETAQADKYLKEQRQKQGQQAMQKWRDKYNRHFSSIEKYLRSDEDDNIDEFLESVKMYAKSAANSNSKTIYRIFKDSKFEIQNITSLKEALDSIKSVIDKPDLWSHITDGEAKKTVFIETYNEIRELCIKKALANRLMEEVNVVIDDITDIISSQTGISSVVTCNIGSVVKRIQTEGKIQRLLEKIILPTNITRQLVHGYQIVVSVAPFVNAKHFREEIKTSEAVSDDLIKPYLRKDYIKFLQVLKNKSFYNPSNLPEYLVCKNVQLLDSEDTPASGGQAVGFTLAMMLEEAKNSSVILIDEPEASLDNAYIKEYLNIALRNLSRKSMVVVITHNSTLGALLDPDYLVVTSRDQDGQYLVQSGEFSSKKISNLSGLTEGSYEKFIEAMESGIETYQRKGKVYGNLKNQQ